MITTRLTDNPTRESMQKGHQLMALCLNTFRPPDIIENYVSVYLMNKFPNQGQQWLSEMHRAQYEGGSQAAMDASAIPAWAAQFIASTKRSRYSMADSGAMIKVDSFRTRKGGETKQAGANSPGIPRTASIRMSSSDYQGPPGQEPVVCRAVAIHTYVETDEEDDGSALTFTKGQEMDILEISEDWWRARIDGVEGWVPEQYIQRL